MSDKWTQELRRIAFARLAMEFGQHYWEKCKNNLPFPGRMSEAEVLTQIANYLSWLTGDKFTATNIQAQLAWVKTEQKNVLRGQTKQFILCKAAAYDVGLIPNQPSRETIIGT